MLYIIYYSVILYNTHIYYVLYVCSVAQSCLTLCVTPWTVTHEAPLAMEFFRQEYWSGLPFPPPEL